MGQLRLQETSLVLFAGTIDVTASLISSRDRVMAFRLQSNSRQCGRNSSGGCQETTSILVHASPLFGFVPGVQWSLNSTKVYR